MFELSPVFALVGAEYVQEPRQALMLLRPVTAPGLNCAFSSHLALAAIRSRSVTGSAAANTIVCSATA